LLGSSCNDDDNDDDDDDDDDYYYYYYYFLLTSVLHLTDRTLAEDTMMQLSAAHGLTGNVPYLKAEVRYSLTRRWWLTVQFLLKRLKRMSLYEFSRVVHTSHFYQSKL